MKLDFDKSRLLNLMKDFHLLTGIRIVLFDDEYQQVLAWPESDCTFCTCMKNHAEASLLCKQSDELSFAESKKEKKLIVYHCHAGLIEATVPLVQNHIVIGYLMFGQISDTDTEHSLRHLITLALDKYQLSDFKRDELFLAEIATQIPLKSAAEIQAAAKILEACTFYAVYDEIIMLKRQNFSDNLRTYISTNLTEDLDAGAIAKSLGISRSKLYLACDKYLGMGIAEFVRDIRIEQAKHLLKNSTLTITEISNQVGFNDYNYFCRVFKKMSGYSPKKYRTLSSK